MTVQTYISRLIGTRCKVAMSCWHYVLVDFTHILQSNPKYYGHIDVANKLMIHVYCVYVCIYIYIYTKTACISNGSHSKTEHCHDANLVVTGDTGYCHNDNPRHHRWRQRWHRSIFIDIVDTYDRLPRPAGALRQDQCNKAQIAGTPRRHNSGR